MESIILSGFDCFKQVLYEAFSKLQIPGNFEYSQDGPPGRPMIEDFVSDRQRLRVSVRVGPTSSKLEHVTTVVKWDT